MTIGEKIRAYRELKNLTQEQLGRLCGTTKQTIYKYETGEVTNIPMPRLEKIAAVFQISAATLLGWNEPKISDDVVTFPITGELAAGSYAHAGQADAIQDSVDIPRQYLRGRPASDYFVLRVVGDSMYPDYKNGDLVLVLKTPTLRRSGQIGVVQHGEDATLKKVEFVMGEDWLRLVPLNREFPELLVEGADLEEWRVRGIPRLVIREIDD